MVPTGSHWIIAYVIPPLLGAGIGYLTNAIAIRMLFRPFTEKRIFGIRVPFTPGVIPKYRYQLAENIGVLVSKELLSREMLEDHILSPVFYGNLSERIGILSESILHKKIGSFLATARKYKDKECFIPRPWNSDEIWSRALIDLLPFDVEELGIRLFSVLYPNMMDTLIESLHKPSVKARLQEEGRRFIEEIQEKLNIFQKFMISAGRYDKTLKKKMPEIVDDIIDKIEAVGKDEKNVELLFHSFKQGLNGFLNTPLQDIDRLQHIRHEALMRVPEGSMGRVLFALRHVRINELLYLQEDQKRELDKFLIKSGIELLVKHLDSILRVINVKGLVIERINKLSIQDVERILLIIIEKHLTWINIFGAIIGSLIGGAQILLRLIR